ncbi:MAG: hypothetical protein WD342_06620 [Verrucomicrobiales bacterium]
MRTCRTLLALFALSALTFDAGAITLTGSNGRKVEFAGIKDATPKGITAQVAADSDLIGVPWEKLDLQALEQEQGQIYAAYLASKDGETVALNLGTFMEKQPGEGEVKPGERRFRGWTHTRIGGVDYLLQMPLKATPRGILLVAVNDYGRAFQYLAGRDRGASPLAELQNKYQLALLTYEFEIDNRDPTVMPSFVEAAKGSGDRLFKALEAMANELDKPELTELPIAIYGSERVGAAFAYNLVQWKPDRIAAAVLSKGAFYTAEPTEASAKVPVLFMLGEYGNQAELWQSDDTVEKVMAETAGLKPNWTAAVEFRGPNQMTPESEYFGRQYLLETLEMRLPEENAAPAKTKDEDESAGEDGDEGQPDAEGQEADEEEEEESEPLLKALDRSQGMIGNLETGEVTKITDPDAELGENETFIPNAEIGKMWKKFLEGELEAALPAANR